MARILTEGHSRLRWSETRSKRDRIHRNGYRHQKEVSNEVSNDESYSSKTACFRKPFNFCVSVPIHKGLHDEILLAFEMNGEPLPTIHGYPLRALVLGYIGARACKWLRRIHLRADPSPAPTQQKEYRWFPRT